MSQEEKVDIPPVQEPIVVSEVQVEVPETVPVDPVSTEPIEQVASVSLDDAVGPKKEAKKSTNSQVLINLVKVCVGSGVLGLPIVFYESGLLESVIIVAAIAYWTYVCSKILVKADKLIMHRTGGYKARSLYSELGYKAFGKVGVYIYEVCTTVSLLGVGVVYILTSSGMLAKLPWTKLGISYFEDNRYIMILFVAILLIPVNLLRDMTSLSWSSMLGNFAISASLMLVLCYGFAKADYNNDLLKEVPWVETSFKGIANLFGTTIYAFSMMLIVLPTIQEMEHPEKFQSLSSISLTISTLFYIIFGILLVILYYNQPGGVESNILYNIPSSNVCYWFTTLFISLMCILSYPVAVMPALQILEPKENENDKGLFTVTPFKIIFRIVIIAGISGIALLFPTFNIVVSLIGNVTLGTVSFIMPPLLYLKLNKHNTRADYIYNGIMALIGFVAACFATFVTIYTM